MNVRIAALAAISLLSACYSYRSAGPVETVAPKPGTRVNLVLTQQAVADFGMQLGPQATYVEGNVIDADSAGLRLAVVRVEDARRTGTDWKGEQVTFPREAIASLSERRLSIGATAIIGGLAVGGVLGAYAAFGTEGGAEGVAVPIGNPTQ
ncbi:MAG: hypothetical protein ACREOF_01130 [Gemmatimonadales bacterium]